MPIFKRSFLPAVLLAVLYSTMAMAQNDPGSLEDLLGADFPPIQPEVKEQTLDLHAPLKLPAPPVPQSAITPDFPSVVVPPPPTSPQSVLEIPRTTPNEPAPEALVLPDLTVPTPQNTGADLSGANLGQGQTVLRPRMDIDPQDRVELLPFDNREAIQDPARQLQPRLQSPRPQPYGYSSYSRTESALSRLMSIPIQVEFYSVSGYQPYGGFVPVPRGYGYGYNPHLTGYRPYGGYGYRPGSGYRGGGRPCPNGGRW